MKVFNVIKSIQSFYKIRFLIKEKSKKKRNFEYKSDLMWPLLTFEVKLHVINILRIFSVIIPIKFQYDEIVKEKGFQEKLIFKYRNYI